MSKMQTPTLAVVRFDNEDVVAASGGEPVNPFANLTSGTNYTTRITEWNEYKNTADIDASYYKWATFYYNGDPDVNANAFVNANYWDDMWSGPARKPYAWFNGTIWKTDGTIVKNYAGTAFDAVGNTPQ